METFATPEGVGLGAFILTLLATWWKIKPAMLKLELDDNSSFRGDLLSRIRDLESNSLQDRISHQATIKEIRAEYEVLIGGMNDRHRAIVKDYEERLLRFQIKADQMMDKFLEKGND